MSAQQRIHLNPNAPRAPMMGQGYAPDSYRPNPMASQGAGGGDDALSQVKAWSSKVEDLIEAYTQVSRATGRCAGRRGSFAVVSRAVSEDTSL